MRLRLIDGTEVERDVSGLLAGPLFEDLRTNPTIFKQVRARLAPYPGPTAQT